MVFVSIPMYSLAVVWCTLCSCLGPLFLQGNERYLWFQSISGAFWSIYASEACSQIWGIICTFQSYYCGLRASWVEFSVLFSHPRRAPWSKPLEHIFQTLLLASAGGSVVWSTSGIMIAMVLTVDPRATAFSSVVCWNGDEFYTSYILITFVKTSVRSFAILSWEPFIGFRSNLARWCILMVSRLD